MIDGDLHQRGLQWGEGLRRWWTLSACRECFVDYYDLKLVLCLSLALAEKFSIQVFRIPSILALPCASLI